MASADGRVRRCWGWAGRMNGRCLVAGGDRDGADAQLAACRDFLRRHALIGNLVSEFVPQSGNRVISPERDFPKHIII